jgi:Nucleoside-diphosphate-sugar pyrophosphorylase involved in lipopolysaccharide biosynthesis/translation initiation factor 2B, gamma/epsilon subunits (eIF-2Bgamma/eIF-2Bepsilon)
MVKTGSFLINGDLSIKESMKQMSRLGRKILFVVDGNNRLLGSLSDGDIRKWILSGGGINDNIHKVYNRHPKSVYEDYRTEDVKKLMLDFLIDCMPVIRQNRVIAQILTWECIFSDKCKRRAKKLRTQVVIMAGGRGIRLDPFTRILPKPLIPIGDKPVVEIIMDKFNECGIREFFLTINHKARMIRSYFEDTDGKYRIIYIEEKKPLGTVGSLRLLRDRLKKVFMVTNCDTIIEADYADIMSFHRQNRNDMTIVVSCKHHTIPYGVCEIENGGVLKDINEKPGYDVLVNTGMYVMNKRMLDLIPHSDHYDVNELIGSAKSRGFKIGAFPIAENSWVDIGQWEEYRKALEKFKVE